MTPAHILIIYLAAVSLLAVSCTVYDKGAAKRRNERVPERTLLLIALFGGAAAMYITMRAIRHKTRKKRFMLTLPLMIILHVLLVFIIFR